MDPVDILTPVIALLAFLGYVWLLSFRFWIAMVLTLSIGYIVAVSIPFDSGQIVYWAAATGVFATALLAMSLLPSPQKFVIEVKSKKTQRVKPEREIVIDGSDVLSWGGSTSLSNLRAVVDYLREKAVMPYVFLDASSQYIARDALIDEDGFAKALGLKKERVMICPERVEVDGFILNFAKEQDLAVVSNDHFEDRSEVARGLNLVRGMLADGQPVLDGV